MLMTDDAMERLAHLCQRQRVGRGASEDKINIAVGFENFTDPIADARSPAVLAVGWRIMRIGFLQRSPGLRATRCDVTDRTAMATCEHRAGLLRKVCAGSIHTHSRSPHSSA